MTSDEFKSALFILVFTWFFMLWLAYGEDQINARLDKIGQHTGCSTLIAVMMADGKTATNVCAP